MQPKMCLQQQQNLRPRFGTSKTHLSHPVAYVMVLLLLIYCCSHCLCLFLVLLFSTLCPSFVFILMGKSCYTLTVFPMSCESVFLTFICVFSTAESRTKIRICSF